MFIIRDREAGNIISKFTSYSDAAKELEAYEAEDKRNGEYTPDFYEIVGPFGDGDHSGDKPETILESVMDTDKNRMKALAEKYGMDFMRNSITREAGGVCVISADLIPELDSLAEINLDASSSCTCLRERLPAQEGYIYKIYCPPEWFDLCGWR